jgi:two-component system, NtrC family, response regulator AtoC
MLSELCAVGIPRLGIIGLDSRVTGSDDTDRGQGGAAKLERTTLRPKDSAEPSMRGFRLLVIGESSHTAHRLPASGEVSIGRSESADVQVQDPLMSRIHCKLQMGPEIWVLDCGSSNGTVVRGHRVPRNERAQISVGDTIEVGSTVVIVQPEFARSTPARTPPSDPAGTTTETGRDDVMDRVYKLARRIAGSNINVLLLGETGVGKEVMAKRIHDLSPRTGKPFVGLNCASLNEQLFESELFGFEKGSFTGAQQTKPGLIETAHGGTVFLDEVGEMALATQAKLLRVLEARQVQRVGGLKPRDVDVRFIAATNQNLEREIEAGMFREDLYYRLNGITLVIPPLRERLAEIPSLARTFIAGACNEAGFPTQPVLSREAVEWMTEHAWPGNIRELKNAVNRAVLLASGGVIRPEHLQTVAYSPRTGRGSGRGAIASTSGAMPAIDDDVPENLTEDDLAERQRIIDALAACGGNQTRAARTLGIARRTLTSRLDKLGLPRPRKGR